MLDRLLIVLLAVKHFDLVVKGLLNHHFQQVISLDQYDTWGLQTILAEEGSKVPEGEGVAGGVVVRDERGPEKKGPAGLIHTAEEQRKGVEARFREPLIDPKHISEFRIGCPHFLSRTEQVSILLLKICWIQSLYLIGQNLFWLQSLFLSLGYFRHHLESFSALFHDGLLLNARIASLCDQLVEFSDLRDHVTIICDHFMKALTALLRGLLFQNWYCLILGCCPRLGFRRGLGYLGVNFTRRKWLGMTQYMVVIHLLRVEGVI